MHVTSLLRQAALLAKGVKAEQIGTVCTDKLMIMSNQPVYENDFITAQIIDIDHFGNITCNFTRFDLERLTGRSIGKVSIRGTNFDKIKNTYSDVKKGELLVLWGSSGFLEIAQNQGNAAESLACDPKEDTVQIALNIRT